MITIDLSTIYKDPAKIPELDEYLKKILELAGDGNEVTLTGKGPVWLYLTAAHALHGKARKLFYSSPNTGAIEVFNHDPF